MLTRIHDPVELLQHRIEGFSDLTDGERHAIAALPIRVVEVAADKDVVRQADRSAQSCMLMQGLACSSKMLGNGKRQIVAFHLPGDMPDLQSLHLGIVDTTITTLTPARIGIMLHEHLRALFDNRRLTTALWRSFAVDAAVSREWIANVGQRDALSRAAHLLAELDTRMHAIGAVEGDRFDLPITQQELGDALGMSTVHVNRCLQALRRQGLISWAGGTLSILDREALADLAGFDDQYLHLGLLDKPAGFPRST